MTKSIASDLLTALNEPSCEPFYALEVLFDDADGTRYDQAGYTGARAVRLWTGHGDRTIDGETYIGSGDVMQISGLEEVSDLSAQGASVTLSGIPSSIMSLALTEPYQGRFARIILGERSVSTFMVPFSGICDEMPIAHSPDSVRITLTIESKLIKLQQSNIRRYTSANHKLRHPNDTFFDWVTSLADKEVVWGRNVS